MTIDDLENHLTAGTLTADDMLDEFVALVATINEDVRLRNRVVARLRNIAAGIAEATGAVTYGVTMQPSLKGLGVSFSFEWSARDLD